MTAATGRGQGFWLTVKRAPRAEAAVHVGFVGFANSRKRVVWAMGLSAPHMHYRAALATMWPRRSVASTCLVLDALTTRRLHGQADGDTGAMRSAHRGAA